MIPVSDEYRARVRQAHRRQVRVTTDTGEVIDVSGGQIIHGLAESSGAQDVRSGTLDLPGYALVPTSPDSLLSPLRKARVHVEIAVAVSTGWEYASHGWFEIVETAVDRPTGGVKVTLADTLYRASLVAVAAPRSLPQGVAAVVVQDVLQEALGVRLAVSRDDSNGGSIPASFLDKQYTVGTSLIELVKDAAAAVDCALSINRARGIELRSLDTFGAPVETLDVGDDGVAVSASSKLSITGPCNTFVSRLEDQANPPNAFTGTATVPANHPLHPTRAGLLRQGETLSGLLSVSQAAANDRAQRELNRILRGTHEIDLQCSPLPHLEAGDAVTVVLKAGTAGGVGRIQKIEHNLKDGGSKILVRWEPNGQFVLPMGSNSERILAEEEA